MNPLFTRNAGPCRIVRILLGVALILFLAAGAVPPATAQGQIQFSDDFETGLDPNVWIIENVGNAEWTYTTEPGNGFIYSPPQSPIVWGNRHVDIFTTKNDFSDFELTCDIRFRTKSWNADQRIIYLRSTDDFGFPYGYHIHFSVEKPTVTPPNYIMIYKVEPPPYTYTYLASAIEFPWALDQWFSFRVRMVGSEIKVKAWPKGDPEPDAWTLETVDPEATYASGHIGFGDYWQSVTDLDNVVVQSIVETVDLDVKPGSCPNPLTMRPLVDSPPHAKHLKGGILPAAVLGTESFDVNQVDLTTLRLEGIAPLRSAWEDVSTPVVTTDQCGCTTAGSVRKLDRAHAALP